MKTFIQKIQEKYRAKSVDLKEYEEVDEKPFLVSVEEHGVEQGLESCLYELQTEPQDLGSEIKQHYREMGYGFICSERGEGWPPRETLTFVSGELEARVKYALEKDGGKIFLQFSEDYKIV